MKKQGKRSKKKHLSKEAFKKIRYEQKMWRIYKYTGKDKDYEAYKEALNAATNEVRKSKRKFEHKLAQNLKSDSKSFYAYVRSKQNVRDKVGPLEDNAGNIITQWFLMAEELNMHFSTVFTREDTSSLPLPETKFKGSEGERLGQLIVTWNQLTAIVVKTPDPELEWPRKECSILYRYGKTEESPKIWNWN